MKQDSLIKYSKQFTKLRRDRKNGGAPHKPVLLLAICRLFEKGIIPSNRIYITPELLSEFKTIWSRLVTTQHNSNFSLPFFHMKSEPFWELFTKGYHEIPITSSNSIRSFKGLNETVDFAKIDQELCLLLLHRESNLTIQQLLIETYFPKRSYFNDSESNSQLDLFGKELLMESPVEYKRKMNQLIQKLDENELEEELYVRGGAFKREIPKLYNFQCAVSGMRVDSASNAQMVDACHIVPFSVSKDDTVSNGISLSPNIHRAFDRGLISFSDDYRVLVSKSIVESNSPYSIKQFDGKPILLPKTDSYQPSIDNLRWHRVECFIS